METVILQSHLKEIISIFFLKQNHIFIVSQIANGIRLKVHTHTRTHTAFDALKILRTVFGLFLFFNQQL